MTASDPSKDPSKEPPPANAGDPSMEDILASIRRILSEDEPGAAPAEPVAQGEDVLMLDASMMLPDPDPGPSALPAPPPKGPSAPPPASIAAPPRPLPESVPPQLPADASLVAPAAAAAAASSVGSLVRSIAAERAIPVYSGGPTLEDMVRAELRPLLKQWLDENLPPMVERLVRAELERVVGRAIS
jgi:uncharacterized protein